MAATSFESLKKRRDFVRIQNSASKRRGKRLIVLRDRSVSEATYRVGFTVSKRVGNAVVRNRVKRRLREIVRASTSLLDAGWDYVVIARPRAATSDFQALRKDFECQLLALRN